MAKKVKWSYDAPKVKVVKFVVEQGFAGSGETTPASSNNQFIVTGNNRVDRTGNDTYYWDKAETTGDNAWF